MVPTGPNHLKEGFKVTDPVLARAKINLREGSFEFEGPPEFVTQQLEQHRSLVERLLAYDQAVASHLPREDTPQAQITKTMSGSTEQKDIERHFGITPEQLSQVLEWDDNGNVHIVANIKGTIADRQRKLSLLYCFTKDFLNPGQPVKAKELRELCTSHGCFDKGNFARNLKKSGHFIFDSKASTYRLTTPAKEEARRLIAELAGGTP